MFKRVTFFTVSVLGLAALFLNWGPSGAVQAQSNPNWPVWGPPVRLSNEGQSSWFPDIAADPSGLVHIVWSSGISTGPGRAYDVVMYTKSEDGVLWTTPRDIAALETKGAVTRPAILIDPLGLFHIAYRRYMIYYAHAPVQDISPQTLSVPFEVSSEENGYFSELFRTQNGAMHLIHTEDVFNPNCNGCFQAFYRTSADDGLTWSQPINMWPFPIGVAKPALAADAQNGLHVLFEVGRGGDLGQVPDPASVAYVHSLDGGLTWSQPFYMSPQRSDFSGRNPAIAIDGNQTLIAVWETALNEQDIVNYQISTDRGATWSEPQQIPGVWGAWSVYNGKTDTYQMLTDAQGRVYLALSGRRSATAKDLSLMMLVWENGAWSAPQPVVEFTGDVPEWPRMAIGLGNQLHMVWFQRERANIFNSDQGKYQVWYSQATLNVPAEAPVPWPTLPAQTVVQATTTPDGFKPTATPQPLLFTNQAEPTTFYKENDYLMIALFSILPVALLVGGVVAYTRWRR
jgi:hypothetical protein